MREINYFDWFAAAFVVVLLIFAFQPLIWVRTIKVLDRFIEWAKRIEIRWQVTRYRWKQWSLGVAFELYEDFRCGPLFTGKPTPAITGRIRYWFADLGLVFFRFRLAVKTERKYHEV